MKRAFLGFGIILLSAGLMQAEGFTLYTGKANKTQCIGIALGGDIWDFLQLQVDAMKYLKQDAALRSDDPTLNRSDFLGVSATFVLKLPLHLVPYLDRFDYIQPYILAGRGYAIESLSAAYIDAPNAVDGAKGMFSKLRSFNSFGYGLIVMISPQFGLKVDYRTIDMAGHTGMGIPGRKFGRTTVGICVGPYKNPIKRIKK